MEDRCPPPSWGCPLLGLVSDRPRHVRQPEASDPAPPCGLTLLSSSVLRHQGLQGRNRVRKGFGSVFHNAFRKTKENVKGPNQRMEWRRSSHIYELAASQEGGPRARLSHPTVPPQAT